jgi:hypothetical protein
VRIVPLTLREANDFVELPAALAEIDAMLASAMPEQIIAALTPVLAQVAATGMSEDDREEWFAATCDALRGIPGDRSIAVSASPACRATIRLRSSRPSWTRVRTSWARRRADRANLRWLALRGDETAAVTVEACTPEQAREIPAEVGMPSAAAERPSAAAPRGEATIADYLAIGLSKPNARQAMAGRRRLLARSAAKPFGSAAGTTTAAALFRHGGDPSCVTSFASITTAPLDVS